MVAQSRLLACQTSFVLALYFLVILALVFHSVGVLMVVVGLAAWFLG